MAKTYAFLGHVGQALMGYEQEKEAKKALEELNKTPYPEYLTGKQVYSQADALATGLSPAEKAFAQQGINRAATSNYRYFADRNPTLSGVAQAIVNDKSAMAGLSLAANDAATRRQSLHGLISLIGSQDRLNTGAKLDQRIRTEQQLGLQQQAGVQNQFALSNFAGNIVGAYLGAGGGRGNQNTGGSGGSSSNNYNPDSGFRTESGFGTQNTSPGWGGAGDSTQQGWNGGNSNNNYYKNNYPYLFGS